MNFKNKALLTILPFIFSITINCFSQESRKPNVIIIVADDLGWGDVGFHESNIRTPNLDQLSKEGVVLDRFYTTPMCTSTRAGLMTGRYPNRFGLRSTVIPPWSKFSVDISEKFLPQFFKEGGYKNRAMVGKWHLGHYKHEFLPLNRGFTHFYGHYNGNLDYFTHEREEELDWHNDWETSFDKGYATDLLTDEAVKCISKYTKEEEPFFLYVAYNAPHFPLQAKDEDLLAYGFDVNKKQVTQSEGEGPTERQIYSAMVSSMDQGIGKILETLKKNQIDDSTLVLFFSDNGAETNAGGSSGKLRGDKLQEWEGGVRVPAIIKWPNGFEGGKISQQLTGYIDVLPTLLDVIGQTGSLKKPLDGKSILPVLEGDTPIFNRDFYLGHGTLISGEWKLITPHEKNRHMNIEEDILFNIIADPYETANEKNSFSEPYNMLKEKMIMYESIKPKKMSPDFWYGKEGFVAPENWNIEN